MFLAMQGSERSCVVSTSNPFCGNRRHCGGAAVAKVQTKMCLQRFALLQRAFQGQRFFSNASSLEGGLDHGNKTGSDCLGRAKFIYCVPSVHFSWAPGFHSCRPSWSALTCDLRNPLRVLEQALFFMQAPFLVSRVTNETPDSPRSPVQEKRAALLDFFRTAGLPAQPVHDASGKLFLTVTRQRANRSHTLLGRTMCSVAFVALTMISRRLYAAASRQARQGRTVWLEQPRKVNATKRTEMINGIWIVVAELHEHSPFAKCESHGLQSLQSLQSGSHPPQKKWNLPFHQKTCLWRLVEKLHGKGQVGVVGGKGLNNLVFRFGVASWNLV